MRALAAERLSDLPLLSRHSAAATKSSSRRTGAAGLAAKPGSSTSRSYQVPSTALGPEPSAVTAISATGTAGASDSSMLGSKSSRSVGATMRGSAADEVLLPAEYAKVVELLKKRGEKGHMILAQSEVRGARRITQASSKAACCLIVAVATLSRCQQAQQNSKVIKRMWQSTFAATMRN